jgi:DNA polymerase III alpha subunit
MHTLLAGPQAGRPDPQRRRTQGGGVLCQTKLTRFLPAVRPAGRWFDREGQYDKNDVECIGLRSSSTFGPNALTVWRSPGLHCGALCGAEGTSSSKTTAGRQDTYALLETETVFQFESVGMQRMLRI